MRYFFLLLSRYTKTALISQTTSSWMARSSWERGVSIFSIFSTALFFFYLNQEQARLNGLFSLGIRLDLSQPIAYSMQFDSTRFTNAYYKALWRSFYRQQLLVIIEFRVRQMAELSSDRYSEIVAVITSQRLPICGMCDSTLKVCLNLAKKDDTLLRCKCLWVGAMNWLAMSRMAMRQALNSQQNCCRQTALSLLPCCLVRSMRAVSCSPLLFLASWTRLQMWWCQSFMVSSYFSSLALSSSLLAMSCQIYKIRLCTLLVFYSCCSRVLFLKLTIQLYKRSILCSNFYRSTPLPSYFAIPGYFAVPDYFPYCLATADLLISYEMERTSSLSRAKTYWECCSGCFCLRQLSWVRLCLYRSIVYLTNLQFYHWLLFYIQTSLSWATVAMIQDRSCAACSILLRLTEAMSRWHLSKITLKSWLVCCDGLGSASEVSSQYASWYLPCRRYRLAKLLIVSIDFESNRNNSLQYYAAFSKLPLKSQHQASLLQIFISFQSVGLQDSSCREAWMASSYRYSFLRVSPFKLRSSIKTASAPCWLGWPRPHSCRPLSMK